MTIPLFSLADLGITDDPGTAWHPDKAEAYDADGHLLDVDDVEEHLAKPERNDTIDGALNGRALSLAAEDSATTPDGEI